jgi:hypothetical protein
VVPSKTPGSNVSRPPNLESSALAFFGTGSFGFDLDELASQGQDD